MEELAKAAHKKLTQGVGEFGKAMTIAKDELAKNEVVMFPTEVQPLIQCSALTFEVCHAEGKAGKNPFRNEDLQ